MATKDIETFINSFIESVFAQSKSKLRQIDSAQVQAGNLYCLELVYCGQSIKLCASIEIVSEVASMSSENHAATLGGLEIGSTQLLSELTLPLDSKVWACNSVDRDSSEIYIAIPVDTFASLRSESKSALSSWLYARSNVACQLVLQKRINSIAELLLLRTSSEIMFTTEGLICIPKFGYRGDDYRQYKATVIME